MVLVTGSGGFIGSHVCRRLTAAGYDVVGLDWPDNLCTTSFTTAPLDAVVNLAAIGGASRAARDPNVVMNNVCSTAQVGSLARNHQKPPHIVHISSFSVYGDAPTPTTENAPLCPKELYGASKLMQELCWTGYPGPLTILRLSSVYGPGMRLDDPEATVIAKIAKAARDGKTFDVNDDGEQTRDFVHVLDVVDMIHAVLAFGTGTRVMNVCSGRSVSIIEACGALGAAYRITGVSRPGDMRHCLGDDRSMREIGVRPRPFAPMDILCAASS